MSSSKGGSKASLIAASIVGGLVVGGAVFVVAKKCMNNSAEDEESLNIRPATATNSTTSTQAATAPPAKQAASASQAKKTASTEVHTPVSSEPAGMSTQQSTAFMQDYSFSAGAAGDDDSAQVAAASSGGPPMVTPDEHGMVHFPQLGIDWQLASGWIANEDAAPMPNVAMVQLMKPEFIERMESPGQMAPVVLIGVEDVSAEGLDVADYREKTKELTMQQLAMMTGGHFAPTVVFDGPMSIGPFTHVIEFALATPFARLQVLNVICMAAGVAYCVRVMAPDSEFKAVKADVMEMVRASKITPRVLPVPFFQWSYIDASSTRAKVRVPTNWIIDPSAASSATSSLLFSFKTMSTTKTEDITIYESESAERVADVATWREISSEDTEAGKLVSYKDRGNGDRRVLSTGTFVVVVASSAAPTIEKSTIVSVASSIVTAASDTQRLRYHSERLGCAFDVDASGRVFESRIAERTVTYHPNGADAERASEGPLLTVRVGDPSNDNDCRATLDEWMDRIKSEAAGSEAGILELKKETLEGRECLTFMNKDMVETGPGQREERIAKVIIFLVGIKTIMLRWEASSGVYRRSERKLANLMSTFKIL